MNIYDALGGKTINECPGKTQLPITLELLQNFSLFATNSEEVQVECLKIERSIGQHFTKNKKQTTINDLFKLQHLKVVEYIFLCLQTLFFLFFYPSYTI